MRRITIRLIIVGVVLVGSWISYQLADVETCSGPKANRWAEASMQRMEESTADSNALPESPSSGRWAELALRARARYTSQKEESPPACLAELQNMVLEVFYYEWQALESAAAGDFDDAIIKEDHASEARRAMRQELERLAMQYGWDVSEGAQATTSSVDYRQPTVPPTRTPSPRTQSIWATLTAVRAECVRWEQASSYIGRYQCICGTVQRIQNSGGTFFIHFGAGDESFYGFSYKYYWDQGKLEGKCVRICGTVEANYGRPRILIDDPDQQVFFCQ